MSKMGPTIYTHDSTYTNGIPFHSNTRLLESIYRRIPPLGSRDTLNPQIPKKGWLMTPFFTHLNTAYSIPSLPYSNDVPIPLNMSTGWIHTCLPPSWRVGIHVKPDERQVMVIRRRQLGVGQFVLYLLVAFFQRGISGYGYKSDVVTLL